MLKFCVILAKFQEMGLGGPAGALVGKKFSDDPPTQGINFFEFFLLHLGYIGPCMNSQKFPSVLLIYFYFLLTFKVCTGPMRPRRVTGGLRRGSSFGLHLPANFTNFQKCSKNYEKNHGYQKFHEEFESEVKLTNLSRLSTFHFFA